MSTNAGGIVLFLLVGIGLPGVTIGLAYVLGGRRSASARRAQDEARSPSPLPSWVPFSITSFAAAISLVVLGASVLAVVVWAVTLHLLDKGYALAEVLLFAVLISAAAAYGWLQGIVRAGADRAA